MKLIKILFFYVNLIPLILSCQAPSDQNHSLYLGADLSYVNEMLDCGGQYRLHGELVDPYKLFAEKGANIVRVRLWHSPDWTAYSDFADVKKTISKARENGMSILLNFHYSDDWADPGDQIIPKAWRNIEELSILGDSLYHYTFETLNNLAKNDLLPEFVQIGNETNSEILLDNHVDELTEPINWERNVFLLNKGLDAVDAISEKYKTPIQSMIHIAQPEFTFPWFDSAFAYGLHDFDWIGLSYYPKWSNHAMSSIPHTIDSLIRQYDKQLMIIETAYPYSLDSLDPANNILGQDALVNAYPASPQGQLNYMKDLTNLTIQGGGEGVIYWEPGWISTPCTTRWGTGSHWENATFFDAANNNEALPVFDFFNPGKE